MNQEIAHGHKELARAREFHARNQLRQALKHYKRYLKQVPADLSVQHVVAGIHYQLEQPGEALVILEQLADQDPENMDYLNDLAGMYLQMARPAEAERIYRQLLSVNPDTAEFWYNLGNALQQSGQVSEAISVFEKTLDLNNRYYPASYNLALSYESLGQYRRAVEFLEMTLVLQPELNQVHRDLARIFEHLFDYGRALKSIEKYIETVTGDHDAISVKGRLLHKNGHTEKAIAYLQDVLSRDNDSVCRNMLAFILNDYGQLEQANSLYRSVLEDKPQDTMAWFGYSSTRKFERSDLPGIKSLEELIRESEINRKQLSAIYFALGKIYDDCGDYRQAFQYYRQANDLRNRSVHFDGMSMKSEFARRSAYFTREKINQLQAMGSDSRVPVLVVGMPRSGTSLVEQIIAAHPLADGAGELMFFRSMTRALPTILGQDFRYPYVCDMLDSNFMHEITDQYVQLLRRHSLDAMRVADKMPGNFLDIGFILSLFPNARIIHCRRNPMDTCLSIYFQNFSDAHSYAFDLENIGHYYLEYHSLMEYWQSLFPESILTVDYENMVLDFNKTAREMINFCELEWDDNCLQYHTIKRNVKTASNWQVRQPVYQGSMNRHEHYADHLEVLESILKPVLEAV